MTLDLRGREIRCCARTEPAEGVYFEMGETTRIRSDEFHSGASNHDCIQVDSSSLPRAVRPGDNISFEEGNLNAVVLETEQDSVKIQFRDAGLLTQGKQVIIPALRLASIPILQPADRQDIREVAIKNNFDFICVPNVTSVKDV